MNTTIALAQPEEEMALSLRDKKRKLGYHDFIDYAEKDLFLPPKKIAKETEAMLQATNGWEEMIKKSFLPLELQTAYWRLVQNRIKSFNYSVSRGLPARRPYLSLCRLLAGDIHNIAPKERPYLHIKSSRLEVDVKSLLTVLLLLNFASKAVFAAATLAHDCNDLLKN